METRSAIKIETNEKRGKGMEKLFFFLLALELIYEVLRTTPFPGYAETAVGNLLGFSGTQTEALFQGIYNIRLLMLIPALYAVIVEMKKGQERILALAGIGLGLFYSFHLGEWNDHTILMLMLLLVASYKKDFRRIAHYSIAIVSILYILTAVICIFGLIPEYNLERDGKIRHSLGFYGVTATAAYMCFVVLLLMFLKSGILHWPEYLLIAFVSAVNLWLVDGRIAMVSMIVATVGTVICSICGKKQWKLPDKLMQAFRQIMCFSYLGIGGGYFILVVTYQKERWEELGKLPLLGILESRVAVPHSLMQILPFSFFGNYLEKFANAEKYFYLRGADANFLESSYARLYLIYGLVGLCLGVLIYTVVQWRLMQQKQTFRMFIVTITAVFFSVQKGMLNPGNTIFPLLLAALIPADCVDTIGEAWAEIINVGKRDKDGVLPRAYEGIDMWEVYRKKPLSYKIAKRVIDIVGSLVAMLLLLPVFIVTAIAIKMQDGGPAVYSGKRYGIDLKNFPMHKFRSMCLDADKKVGAVITDADKNGLAFKIKDDPRITKVGKFIRKTSIDELPQFWNVLMGEMSLVGPRPIQTTDKEIEPYEKQRWAVKPGITCIWQVAGRALVPWDEWVEMDLKYISEMSLKTDIKLMVITIVALWRKDGAM